jgi:hypothetical protein
MSDIRSETVRSTRKLGVGHLLPFSKLLAPLPLLFWAVVAAKLQTVVSNSFLHRLLRFLSKCVLLIIAEVPIPLSKQYY